MARIKTPVFNGGVPCGSLAEVWALKSGTRLGLGRVPCMMLPGFRSENHANA